MTIEKIYIPTYNRIDNQITYNSLPPTLKNKVIMVVQSKERYKYSYPCEYLILPDYITSDFKYAISHTRKFIYEHGKNSKYAMIDDDIVFARRNSKYWTNNSNMEQSKKISNEKDIEDMFNLFDMWLDEGISVCGCSFANSFPGTKEYDDCAQILCAFWIDGNKISDILDNIHTDDIQVEEDIVFLLSLLSNGHKIRKSHEFLIDNISSKKQIISDIWNKVTVEDIITNSKKIEKLFPNIYNLEYDIDGSISKNLRKIKWKFKNLKTKNLDSFF